MGMNKFQSIRQGKHFEMRLMRMIRKMRKKVDEMCKKLLVNIIIEDYKINKIS